MGAIYVSWAISGVVLLGLAIAVGLAANSRIDGILIDERGRYSLTHLQLSLWTITILSLVSGVFFGRLVHGVAGALDFKIPAQVLAVLGISLGSAVAGITVKRTKDVTRSASVAASGGPNYPPRLAQVFLVEEGTFADQAVDIGKFQGFVITIVLVVAYTAVAVNAISAARTAQGVTTLPHFSDTFVTLFGISHGAYIVGKLPTAAGRPDLTVQERNEEPGVFRVLSRTASTPLPQ